MHIQYGAHSSRLSEKPPGPLEERLRALTLYEPDELKQQAMRARWSGGRHIETKKYLYHRGQRAFPTGLLTQVQALMPDVPVVGMPELSPPRPYKVHLPEGYEIRRVQHEAFEALTQAGRGVAVLTTASGKTLLAAMLASAYPEDQILITTPGKRLLHQNFKEVAEFTGEAVGILGDSERDLEPRILVATIQSLAAKVADGDVVLMDKLAKVRVWVCDESHGAAAESYRDLSRVLTACHNRFGLTASWLREDGCFRVLEGVLSTEVVYTYSYEDALADGIVTPIRVWLRPHKHRPPTSRKKLPWTKAYAMRIVNNPARNLQVALDTIHYVVEGMSPTLVLVRAKDHGKILAELLGCPFINGEDQATKKGSLAVAKTLEDFLNGEFPILVASNILNVGVNLKPLRSAVNAAAGESRVDSIQKPGRGVRLFPNKSHFDYTDYLDDDPEYFKGHAISRRLVFQAQFVGRVRVLKGQSVIQALREVA